jgi:hypothetical protein
METEFEYDVCLSFAGEQRSYVREVADALKANGLRVFYDEHEMAVLWGKDLYVHLSDVYKNHARYCILFASKEYRDKLWTNHERQSAQARAFEENKEYILPALFDDVEIPGVLNTVGHVDLRFVTPQELAQLVQEKIGMAQKELSNYLPPVPDKLYAALQAETEGDKLAIYHNAQEFFTVLRRMSDDERLLLFNFVLHGCAHYLPKHIHISVDLLRRVTEFPVEKIKGLLAGLIHLGFGASVYREEYEAEEGKLLPDDDKHLTLSWTDGNHSDATEFAYRMMRCGMSGYCEEHSIASLLRLDFSQLSSATEKEHTH